MNGTIRHVAIIMDGNGRWAEQRGLPRTAGHRQGAKQVSEVLEAANECGVEFLTLYAFSTENWKRPPAEIAALMNLLEEFIDRNLPELQKREVRLRTIGRTGGLPAGARKKLLAAVEATKNNAKGTLNLALNYGGRAEIVDAVNRITAELAGQPRREITEESFRNYLYAPDIPDPDLLIRTSGEQRLSNYLLWQLAYSEFYFTPVPWPDFSKAELEKAVEAYNQRDRRYGGVKEEV